jgi:hypothetical protein
MDFMDETIQRPQYVRASGIARRHITDAMDYACLCAAFRAGVTDPGSLSAADLREQLAGKNPDLARLLRALREAYDEWIAFHAEIESSGNLGDLSDKQFVRRSQLSDRLEGARKLFMTAMRA